LIAGVIGAIGENKKAAEAFGSGGLE